MYASLRYSLVTLLLFISIGCIFSNVQIRETKKVSNAGGNIFQMTQLNVECNDNEVLSYWRLISHSDKIHIQYYCISGLSVLITSNIKFTKWNKTSNNKKRSVNFLDRHRVMCDSDEAIGAFQMQSSGKDIRFRYRCNKIKRASGGDIVSRWEKANLGEVQNLKVQIIAGIGYKHNLEALRGWRLRTKYVYRWCTFMCDTWQYIRFEIFYSNLAKNVKSSDEDLDMDF